MIQTCETDSKVSSKDKQTQKVCAVLCCCLDFVVLVFFFFKSELLLSTTQTNLLKLGMQGQLSYKIPQDWSSWLIVKQKLLLISTTFFLLQLKLHSDFLLHSSKEYFCKCFPSREFPIEIVCITPASAKGQATDSWKHSQTLPISLTRGWKLSFEWLFRPLESTSSDIIAICIIKSAV